MASSVFPREWPSITVWPVSMVARSVVSRVTAGMMVIPTTYTQIYKHTYRHTSTRTDTRHISTCTDIQLHSHTDQDRCEFYVLFFLQLYFWNYVCVLVNCHLLSNCFIYCFRVTISAVLSLVGPAHKLILLPTCKCDMFVWANKFDLILRVT